MTTEQEKISNVPETRRPTVTRSTARTERTERTERTGEQNTELQTEKFFEKKQKRTTLLTEKKLQSTARNIDRTIVRKFGSRTERDTSGIGREFCEGRLSNAGLRNLKNLRSSNTKPRSTSESRKKKDIIARSATPLVPNPAS